MLFKDFRGAPRTCTRAAQRNATAESSADAGGASIQYDNLGLTSQIIETLGHATTITRNAPGRAIGTVLDNGKTPTLRYDLRPTDRASV